MPDADLAHFSTLKSQRFIKATIRRGFHHAAARAQLLANIAIIPPLARSRPIDLQIWFGFAEPPADAETVEIYFHAVDINNLPDVASSRSLALWQAAQDWFAVGTPATIVQTVTGDRQQWLEDDKNWVDTISIRNRQTNMAWAILSSGDAVSFRAQGVLTYEMLYLQRVWPDDNWTFDSMDDEGALFSGMF